MKLLLGVSAPSESIWERFTEFFSPELGAYDNLHFNEGSFVSVKYIIIGLFFGIIIAAFSAFYNRRVLGKFIRALLAADATSPDKAKTLAELGFDKNGFVRTSLRNGCTLKNSTSCVEFDEFLRKMAEEDAQNAENASDCAGADSTGADGTTDGAAESTENSPARKIDRRVLRDRDFIPDLASARFYISEDKKYSTEIKFEEKGTNLLTLILAIVFAVIFVGVAVLFFPDVLRFIDNFLNVIKGK